MATSPASDGVTGATITPRIDFARELAGLYDLSGRVAFLPGGYGGIGEAIAWALALAGAKVVVAGRSAEKAEALASSLRAAKHDARGLALDVLSVAEIRAVTDAAAALRRHAPRLCGSCTPSSTNTSALPAAASTNPSNSSSPQVLAAA